MDVSLWECEFRIKVKLITVKGKGCGGMCVRECKIKVGKGL